MFIEITDDLIKDLNTLEDNEIKERIWLLINDALHSVLHRHHIVFATYFAINLLMNDSNIDNSNKKVLCWMQNKMQDLNAIKQKVAIVLELSAIKCSETIRVNGKSRYVININDLEEFKESVLITENTSDYDFYLGIFNWYNDNSICALSISNLPSNGSNADKIILSSNNEKKFVGCIFDSDKDYQRAKIGGTIKKAKEAENKRKFKFLPFELHELPVREKENIFPFREYEQESNIEEKTKKMISALLNRNNEDLMRYFDIKDGIKHKTIKNKSNDDVWKSIYESFIEQCNKEGLCLSENTCKSCRKPQCTECKKGETKYIAGIGDKLLETVSKNFFQKYPKKIQDLSKLNSIFFNQKYILEEWEIISKILFNFGCSISRSINFIY